MTREASVNAPAEGNHDPHIGESHLLAHPAQRRTFQREALGIGRMGVAGGTAKSQHGIFFLGLEVGTSQELGILVGLEIRQPDDHGLGIKGCCDRANPLGEALDKERRGIGVVSCQPGNALAIGCRGHLVGTCQRHRMDADMVVDDELHARQADAIVGPHRRLEGKLRVAEIDHDRRPRPRAARRDRSSRPRSE